MAYANSETPPSSDKEETGDPIIKEIEASRKELLDFSLRNPLLNYRTLKSRGVEVVDEIPSAVFDVLVKKGRRMSFTPRRDGDSRPNSLPPRRNAYRLQTNEPDNQLQSRLLKTYHAVNTVIQEQGVNTLFISLGMVEWYESDSSNTMRRAPLVLVPVKIARSDVRRRFHIEYTGEELGGNRSFIEKVQTEFGPRIPDPPNEEDLDVDKYFAKVSTRVEHLKRWSVDRESVVLGFFSFGKFLMYKDLDPNNWPSGMGYGPQESSIICNLFAEGFSEPDPKIHEEDNLDDHLRPEDIHHVMDADASQTLAIFDVSQGRNFVIQGPPGTGKSQTIVNIIAEAIADGKTVLFVSEKMAALEVVKRRLDNIGLGVACLELHSQKTNKKVVLDELNKTLELRQPNLNDIESDFKALTSLRNILNEYADAVNSTAGDTGVTPYRAYGEYLCIRRQEQEGPQLPSVEIADINSWSGADFESKKEAVSQLQSRLKDLKDDVGVPQNHPFWGSSRDMLTPNDQASLEEKIDTAIKSLETLQGTASDLAEALELKPPEDAAQTEDLLPIAERAAKAPDIQNVDLSAFQKHSQRDEMKRLTDAGRAHAGLHSKYGSILKPSAWNADAAEIHDTLSTIGRKFWRFLYPKYRRDTKYLAELCRVPLPSSVEDKIALVNAILQEQKYRQTFEQLSQIAKVVLGPKWQGAESDWDAISRTVEWALELFKDVDSGAITLDAVLSMRKDIDAAQVGDLLSQVKLVSNSHPKLLDELQSFLQIDPEKIFKGSLRTSSTNKKYEGLITLPFVEQSNVLKVWSTGIDNLHDLIGFNRAAHDAKAKGLGSIVELGEEWPEAVDHLINILKLKWYLHVISCAYYERPALAGFNRNIHEDRIGKFRQLDESALDHNRTRVACSHWSQLPKHNAGGQLGILRREFEKKRRHLPIRQLMNRAGEAIQDIKPVFMMSPMSIATYLRPGSVSFDLAVFDEASQVRPADALGTLMRAKQSVVVGDSMQLPPTSFFDNVTRSDEDEEEHASAVADMESILGLFRAQGAPNRMLRWHYRSRHESLIAVSNREFYENRLTVYPSPYYGKENFGLKYHHLSQAVYDRGKSRTNRKEAERVAASVMEHARQSPELTLGVAAFSSAQRDAIQDQLEILRLEDPSCETFFYDHPEEPFFVKNLENIQGDERDVIFISIGYGRDANGQVAMNFGPLTADGGERRLNVLITRAKQRCEVFTNLRAADIDLRRTRSRGVRALKTFLAYADTGVLKDPAEESGREVDSPFQKEVASKLRSLGHDIREEVGTGGKFIDLAVVDPEHPGRYILGIECDGAAYHSSSWARDRDRLREQYLNDLGWKLYRIWSTDWSRNPERELERTNQAIEQAKATAPIDISPQKKDRPRIEREDKEKLRSDLVAPRRYELARPSINTYYYELHKVPLTILRDPIIDIVRTESPVHVSDVRRRIADAWPVKRIGDRIKQNLDRAIRYAEWRGEVVKKGEFLWDPGMQLPIVRDRSDLAGKKIEMVSPEEIAEALKEIVKHSYRIDRKEAASETARLLGFRTVSRNVGERIYRVIERLIETGDLAVFPANLEHPLTNKNPDSDLIALPSSRSAGST